MSGKHNLKECNKILNADEPEKLYSEDREDYMMQYIIATTMSYNTEIVAQMFIRGHQ